MRLFALAALVAVCGAAKLDRGYLPPASSQTAGGLPGDLQTPFARSSQNNQGLGGIPTGAYNNDFGGVVVDASAAGTRAAGPGESGLGNPRQTYGSQASKVGDAAFRQSQNGFHNPGFNFQANAEAETVQGFVPQSPHPERQQAAQDRAANTIRFDSEVGPENFNYAFETDNGITAEENGVATNGVQAQGAFSYKSDDGQTYSVSYTADENGYQPKGDHLPTPPPIPEEILKSLEKNAQDEAAGLIDDGSYDAGKYNAGSDYSESDKGLFNGGQSSVGSANGASDVNAGSFVSQSFSQHNADAASNGGNFEPSASNDAPGQFAQLSQSGQQKAFGQSSGQSFGQTQKLQALNNFGYLPPQSQASSQASFSGFQQQLNQKPNFQRNNGFSNSRPSQSPISASVNNGQVNEPQATSAQFNIASAQTQVGYKSQNQPQQNYPSQNSNAQFNAKFSQAQSNRPTQQTFNKFNANRNAQGSAPTPTQSASAFASFNSQQNQFSGNNPQAFPAQNSQGQNLLSNQFSAKQVQQSQFNQPQFASSTQRPGFGFQNAQDDSYYYNQPAQPFRTPTEQRNPNPSAEFDRLAQSYSANANSQLSAFPTQPSFTQQGSGSTRYPRPPTLAPAAPTVSIQPAPTVSIQPDHDYYNGITQATASSFSVNQQGTQAVTRPSQPRFPSQRPTQQSFGASTPEEQPTPSQQYDGELYDYSKPADTLTTPKDSNPQGSEPEEAEVSPTQNTQVFASAEFQGSSVAPGFNQVANLENSLGVNAPRFNNQASAEYSQAINSVAPGFDQASAEYTEGSGVAPGFSQVSAAAVAGRGEVFGGPRQPPRFDEETGYHY